MQYQSNWKRKVLFATLSASMAFGQTMIVSANDFDEYVSDGQNGTFEELPSKPSKPAKPEVPTLDLSADQTNDSRALPLNQSLYGLKQQYNNLLNQLEANPGDETLASQVEEMRLTLNKYEADPMYRLYNPNSGEHFYTANSYERDSLVKAGWHDEGIGWYAPKIGSDVYRLYNPNGEHHYTLNSAERDMLVNAGWKDEGIGWKSMEETDLLAAPLYRQYNPNEKLCNHNYTTNLQEHQSLVKIGWKDEGLAWHGVQTVARHEENGNLQFFDGRTMQPVYGFFEDQGQTYYLDPENNGIAFKGGRKTINGKIYLFNEAGQQVRYNGQFELGDGFTYWMDADGSLLTGIQFMPKTKTGQPSCYIGFDSDGRMIKNTQSGGLNFDGQGHLLTLTPDQQINQMCFDVYAQTGTSLEALFDYTITKISYVAYTPQWATPPEGWTHLENFARLGLTTGQGNCYVFASVFGQLARRAGYTADFVKGGVRLIDGSISEHGWTEVYVDGQWYVCDASFAHSYGKGYGWMRPINRLPFQYVSEQRFTNF